MSATFSLHSYSSLSGRITPGCARTIQREGAARSSATKHTSFSHSPGPLLWGICVMPGNPWDNHPTELPDGRLVCPHGLVICGICTVDYSFMDEILNEDRSDSDTDMDDDDIGERSSVECASDDDPGQSRASNEQFPSTTGRSSRGKFADSNYEKPNDFAGMQLWPPIGIRGMPTKRRMRRSISPPPGRELVTCDRFENAQQTSPPWRLFNHDEGNLRFSRKVNEEDEVLLYADGACLNNGSADARGGCAFVFQPEDSSREAGHEYKGFALEKTGPTGLSLPQTNNRAELRAVIAALDFRVWHGEGWDRVVIATDSSYVVDGITNHTRTWLRRKWKTAKGCPVMNRDLWEALLDSVRGLQKHGIEVVFWRIPREWNSKADLAAKAAAQLTPAEHYTKISGIAI